MSTDIARRLVRRGSGLRRAVVMVLLDGRRSAGPDHGLDEREKAGRRPHDDEQPPQLVVVHIRDVAGDDVEDENQSGQQQNDSEADSHGGPLPVRAVPGQGSAETRYPARRTFMRAPTAGSNPAIGGPLPATG